MVFGVVLRQQTGYGDANAVEDEEVSADAFHVIPFV